MNSISFFVSYYLKIWDSTVSMRAEETNNLGIETIVTWKIPNKTLTY